MRTKTKVGRSVSSLSLKNKKERQIKKIVNRILPRISSADLDRKKYVYTHSKIDDLTFSLNQLIYPTCPKVDSAKESSLLADMKRLNLPSNTVLDYNGIPYPISYKYEKLDMNQIKFPNIFCIHHVYLHSFLKLLLHRELGGINLLQIPLLDPDELLDILNQNLSDECRDIRGKISKSMAHFIQKLATDIHPINMILYQALDAEIMKIFSDQYAQKYNFSQADYFINYVLYEASSLRENELKFMIDENKKKNKIFIRYRKTFHGSQKPQLGSQIIDQTFQQKTKNTTYQDTHQCLNGKLAQIGENYHRVEGVDGERLQASGNLTCVTDIYTYTTEIEISKNKCEVRFTLDNMEIPTDGKSEIQRYMISESLKTKSLTAKSISSHSSSHTKKENSSLARAAGKSKKRKRRVTKKKKK